MTGRLLLGCLAALAIINYTEASCQRVVVDGCRDTPRPVDDNTAVGTLIWEIRVTDNEDDFEHFAVPESVDQSLSRAFQWKIGTRTPNIASLKFEVGPEFKDLVDIKGKPATFYPNFTILCPSPGPEGPVQLFPEECKLTVVDQNNQRPKFEESKDITIYLDSFNKANKINVESFRVFNNDSTVNNAKVKVTAAHAKLEFEDVKITLEPKEPGQKETQFDLLLAKAPAEAGDYEVILTAKEFSADTLPGDEYKVLIKVHNGAFQQTGAFLMVALVSIISTFVNTY